MEAVDQAQHVEPVTAAQGRFDGNLRLVAVFSVEVNCTYCLRHGIIKLSYINGEEHMTEQSHSLDMTVGQPWRKMVRFALPLFVGNLFQQLYNTVDSMVVGNMLGKTALAAVGTGFPFLMTLVSAFMGIGIAATVLISQSLGAHDYQQIQKVTNTVYRISLYVAVPLTLLGIICARPVLILLRTESGETLEMATSYLQILFAGMIATEGYNLNSGMFQGLGDSVTSVKLLILSTLINIPLDILLVGPAGMGVAGAAWATVIAQAVSWLIGLHELNRRFPYVELHLLRLDFVPELARQTIRMGIPSALQNVLFSVGSMTMYALVNSFGSTFMAGFTGANKLDTLVFFPILSLSNALTSYTGQNVGARNLPRVHQGMRQGMVLALIAGTAIPAVLYPLSATLMRLFGSDPGMIEGGVIYLHNVLPWYFGLAILFAYNGVLRGLGQMNLPLVSTIVAMVLGRIPAAYLLAELWGREYIFHSYGVGWILGSIISAVFFYRGRWRQQMAASFELTP